jgi:hypothetical protein
VFLLCAVKVWLTVTFVCQCIVSELFVKEKYLKCSECHVYALVPAVSEGGWHEVEMNMTYVPEHVKT